MVINEAMKNRFNAGRPANLYFYRDNTRKEVDLLHPVGNDLYAYAIKSAATFHADFTKGLNYLKTLFGDRVKRSTVIYDGATSPAAINVRDFRLE